MATAIGEQAPGGIYGGITGEAIGEFFGTMVLLLFGDGCVAGVLLFGVGNNVPLFVNWITIALGWGLAVTLGVYVAGTVSGAHLNPAVTLAFAARGKFPWAKVGPYVVAQVLGAFVAALILWMVYHGAFMHFEQTHSISRGVMDSKGLAGTEAGVFFTSHPAFVSIFNAFFDQVLGTALLVGLIFAIVDVKNSPPQGNLAPLIIGFLVVAIGLSFGYNAGYAINPARDFGPRLLAYFVGFKGIAFPGVGGYWWVPIIGPLIGGVVGAFVYDFTVHRVLVAQGVVSSGDSVETGTTDRERNENVSQTGRA